MPVRVVCPMVRAHACARPARAPRAAVPGGARTAVNLMVARAPSLACARRAPARPCFWHVGGTLLRHACALSFAGVCGTRGISNLKRVARRAARIRDLAAAPRQICFRSRFRLGAAAGAPASSDCPACGRQARAKRVPPMRPAWRGRGARKPRGQRARHSSRASRHVVEVALMTPSMSALRPQRTARSSGAAFARGAARAPRGAPPARRTPSVAATAQGTRKGVKRGTAAAGGVKRGTSRGPPPASAASVVASAAAGGRAEEQTGGQVAQAPVDYAEGAMALFIGAFACMQCTHW